MEDGGWRNERGNTTFYEKLIGAEMWGKTRSELNQPARTPMGRKIGMY